MLRNSSKNQLFWVSLSFTFALIYSWLGLQQAFSSEYIVQDDARQHVFWMLRFVNPSLFPNDIIADYFQSVAPVGYSSLYRFAAFLGINPLVFNKFLPSILTLITTGYCFGVAVQLLPLPVTGFIASLILNQHLWMEDNLASGTPRAFFAPILLAFFYYLLRGSLIPCLITIALMGLFYPQMVFIAVGILGIRLFQWRKGPKLSSRRQDYWFWGAGLLVAFLVLLPYALRVSEFDPVIDVATARISPEFWIDGRNAFFFDDFWTYWFGNERSGMFAKTILTPATLSAALLLPILISFPKPFLLVQQVRQNTILLLQVMIVGIGLFLAAHALLFRLHLPSRYTQYSFPIVLALGSAIAITILFHTCFLWIKTQPWLLKIPAGLLGIFLTCALIFYPNTLEKFPKGNYKTGNLPELYRFFAQQPADITIVSLTEEADFIPSFSQRSVFVSRETAIPYHRGYYGVIEQRTQDLIQAQYALEAFPIQQFIQQYNPDFWLISLDTFSTEDLEDNDWLQQFQPVTTAAVANLSSGRTPAILKTINSCSVWRQDEWIVLDTACVDANL
jgi:hypothetical protein